MSFLGLFFAFGGLGFLCRLLLALAIYALPVFVGLSIGAAAFKSGAGYGGAFVMALAAGAATLAFGKFACASVRSPAIRGVVGLVYAVPAAVGGYEATDAFAGVGLASGGWRVVLAGVGGLILAVAAWSRLSGAAVIPARAPRAVTIREAGRAPRAG